MIGPVIRSGQSAERRRRPIVLQSIDPATGKVLADYPTTSRQAAFTTLERAAAAQSDWRRESLDDRLGPLRSLADYLRSEAAEGARLMALEMGKPLAQGLAEMEKCAWACEYYADHAPEFLADEVIPTDARRSFVAFRPLGVVLAIMPWNFPYWQVLRCAAPALSAGNGFVLKHAPNVPGCSEHIARLFARSGFPDGLFANLLVAPADVADLSAELIAHPAIAAVTLTGSDRAGRAVAAAAGQALKPTVLELGGSDPYVVLGDADVALAVEQCAASRLINSGQSCIAAKRFIVHHALAPEFVDGLVARLAAARVGPPLEEATQVGPLARADLRAELHRQATESVAAGARVLVGGTLPEGSGWYYPPTVLADVMPGMPAFDEETFGPLAAVSVAESDEAALGLANASRYGLGAAVFTRDAARGEQLAANEIDAGSCFVNAFVRSDPRLPFGGTKQSGYGRELGLLGLRSFVNAKTVYVG
jgi:succinate-semialdehyde dehydrogenase/glutarate-semialdehyde dehydrogenase